MNQYAPVMELVLTQLAQGVNKAFCFPVCGRLFLVMEYRIERSEYLCWNGCPLNV